jgi:hypothetical protein
MGVRLHALEKEANSMPQRSQDVTILPILIEGPPIVLLGSSSLDIASRTRVLALRAAALHWLA